MKYFVIDPTVFVEIKNGKMLLYNSYNGEKLLVNDQQIVNLFINGLNKMNIFPIENEVLETNKIRDFIIEIEKNDFGYLLSNNKTLPIQFAPLINIQTENDQEIITKDNSFNPLIDIREISIHLNGVPDNIQFSNLSKQINCIHSELNTDNLNFNQLSKFLLPIINVKSLFRINLLGGNVLTYPYLEEVKVLLLSIHQSTQICVYLLPHIVINNAVNIKEILDFQNLKFIFNLNPHLYKEFAEILPKYLPSSLIEYNLIIESEDDLIYFNSIENNLIKSNLIPLFNGLNFDFFEKNVFTDFDDIKAISISQNEVYQNKNINSYNFGKLVVLHNGDIYANLNKKMLGNIESSYAPEIILNEYKIGESWFLTRLKVSPCKNCIYNFLCPPVSNYELLMNKFNLCHIS